MNVDIEKRIEEEIRAILDVLDEREMPTAIAISALAGASASALAQSAPECKVSRKKAVRNFSKTVEIGTRVLGQEFVA